jgi:multidrug efflux pump subunit AcrB
LASLIGVIAFSSTGVAFLSVWLFSYPAGFNTIIGTIGMVGVAVNDSITLLSALEADPDANVGDPKAVREIVVINTRHILATSVTTIVSCLPLIIGGGGFWPPLAVSLAGGIVGSTLLALYFIPPVYLLLKRKKTKF